MQHSQKLKKMGIVPRLKVILVGENPASVLYSGRKEEFVRGLGAECEIVKLKNGISREDFIRRVGEVVDDESVQGCLIQLPLPPQLADISVGNWFRGRRMWMGFTRPIWPFF